MSFLCLPHPARVLKAVKKQLATSYKMLILGGTILVYRKFQRISTTGIIANPRKFQMLPGWDNED
ncbi:MAG: hypothetical protein A3J35_03340 [Gammaproteobacteria bacterium RIFCSPLOWO2_02_FULL_52_10]|nr:MAG: hypothetical protein A3J35_03340 [Gammaproteobacteria bacterium RIFCSPLOWO2_02_FULL_52_10]